MLEVRNWTPSELRVWDAFRSCDLFDKHKLLLEVRIFEEIVVDL